MFSPCYEAWCDAVRRVRPDLVSAFNPWDRITTPDAVRRLFSVAGIARVEVEAESGCQPLSQVEDFWTIALGSGLRWVIDELGPELADLVCRDLMTRLAAMGADRAETNVIYAVA